MIQKKTYIIAEAGVNHNGSIDLAKKLIDLASNAGADAVKFQTFTADRLVSKKAPKAKYQMQTTDKAESQYEMIKRLELSREAHIHLIDHCRNKSIEFLSTPFDLKSIDLLSELGLQTFKIGSGEITNLPYLRKIGSLKKKIILSTGMSDLGEIEDALDILQSAGTPFNKITVLHCNSEYPTPKQDVNLRAMLTIQRAFPGIYVGYSDHTIGIEVPIAAVAMGATVVEKHFTLDRNMPGPDHKASLEPTELCAMIDGIRNIEMALGHGVKRPSSSEAANLAVARKSIVAARPIASGEIFTEENLAIKRPGTGISPMRWYEMLGKKSNRPYAEDELIDA